MRLLKLFVVILPLYVSLFTISAAFAEELQVDDDTIHITAETMEHGSGDGTITARDNVRVSWRGGGLTADNASYDRVKRVLYANGNVTITKDHDRMTGESVRMNLEDGRAEIGGATLSIPSSSITLKSEKLTRINENRYEAASSELSTCEWPDPGWKFGINRLNIDVMGYATGRHVIFYIKDIPVLYLPWIAFPASQEKRSGLLIPRIGYSNTRGARLDIPLYLVLSPSQDLLLDLDLLSLRGVGTGFDYRYIRQRGSEGRLGGYQIYDLVQDRWRWQIGQHHQEIFSADANLRMDVNLLSDRLFATDYGEKSGDYNRQSTDTIVNALKTWQTYALTAYLRYVEDLYAPDNSAVLQTLPSVGVSGVRQSLFALPLYFDIDAELANFYRETPPSGQRFHLFPRLTVAQSVGSWLQTSLFAGMHLRGYATERHSGDNGRGVDGDLLPEVGARLSTSVFRLYDINTSQLTRIRHELVPEITYGYLPQRSQQRLPRYDVTDQLAWRNVVGVSLNSMINGRFRNGEQNEYRDISRVKLMAGYSFEGERQDLLTLVDRQRPWTDLILETDSWLNKLLKVTLDSRFNLYDKRISSVAVGLEADDRQGNSAAVGYQMALNEVEYFEARLSTAWLKPITLNYTTRYSFDKGDFLESVYAAEYRHKCWSINLAVHQRPGNQSYTINFNLAGLTTGK